MAGLLVTVPLYTGFDMTTPAMQFVELKSWIPLFNIYYHLGVDSISMLFVILNSLITVIVVLAGWKVADNKVAQYYVCYPDYVGTHEWHLRRARRPPFLHVF